ncbi:hypothetical protein EV126DRAFT_447265 [Verticillium dahliae]|nr:hypothetical protein EV126DRAFT_447265 [Verticillium dahliae]
MNEADAEPKLVNLYGEPRTCLCDTGRRISATAISEPFPLFTQEAIAQMRAEIFSKDSLENCQYSSSFCKNMIRAMGQRRYIEHQALKAFGGSERITMVTSFRAKSPFVKDESVLTGVRGISNVSDLYTQYTRYRLEILEDRIRAKRKSENYRAASKRPFDVDEIRVWLETQRQFIDAMLVEIHEVEDGEEE